MARPRHVVENREQLRLLPDNKPLEGLTAKSRTELRKVIAELLLDGLCPKAKEDDRHE